MKEALITRDVELLGAIINVVKHDTLWKAIDERDTITMLALIEEAICHKQNDHKFNMANRNTIMAYYNSQDIVTLNEIKCKLTREYKAELCTHTRSS